MLSEMLMQVQYLLNLTC